MALSVSFNWLGTSFVAAHDEGFTVYDVKQEVDYQVELPKLDFPVRCATTIGNTSYVAIIRHMSEVAELWDCRAKARERVYYSKSAKDVRSLLATPRRVIVVCKSTTSVFDLEDQKQLAEFETAENEIGLGALGGGKADSLVLPGRTSGQVQVVELEKCKVRHVFPAHKSALSGIGMSKDAKYVATASQDGTIFRIFSLPDQTLVKQLRRGIDKAVIFSMKISPDNAFLAVTSGNGTLHVFTLAQHQPSEPEQGSSQDKKADQQKITIPRLPPGSSVKDRLAAGPILSGSPLDDFDIVEEDAPSVANSGQPAGPKFGILGKLPFAPSFLKDQYSSAIVKFDTGLKEARSSPQETPGSHPSGQIEWLDSHTLVVVRVRPSGFWEKFNIRNAVDQWKIERITSKKLTF